QAEDGIRDFHVTGVQTCALPILAAILEDAGFVVMVRGQGVLDDAFSHLGSTSIMTTYVLVPEKDAEAAAALIAETVTDYEGDELDELLERMATGEVPPDFADADDADDTGDAGFRTAGGDRAATGD